MKKTKLVRVLASFSQSELRRLKDFVSSPYFNKNPKITLLLEFLIQFAPDFDHEKLCEEMASDYVFNGEAYNDKAITKLSSKLYKLVRTFVRLEKTDDNKIQPEIDFLTFLNEKGLYHEYGQHLMQIKKDLDRKTMHDADFFYNQFLVEQEVSKLQKIKSDRSSSGFNYQTTVNALDKFYLLTKMNYLCLQMNLRQTKPDEQSQYEMINELLSYVPNSPYFNIPSVKIWFTTLQLLWANKPEKPVHYHALKKLVYQHFDQLNKYDIKNVFGSIQNNAKYVFEFKKEYYEELFDLYQFQLSNGIFKDPLLFTESIFLNIVTTGLLLNKLGWIEEFLKEHQNYSDKKDNNLNALAEAMLAFERDQFSEALDFLNACHFKNIYFKLSERRLRLKVYYEMKLHRLIDDGINSFRKFLSTNKRQITDLHLEANRNFVNLVNQIFYLVKNDKEKIQLISSEINKTGILPEKRWLADKISSFRD